eukprot:comp19510_c0_seq1/m.37116 comp19510_c0_seq1/g.37116  ORF comp19510_c0_seq1/g.37116 comp19510_c0_seq1/m.37116 type:complete len:254 (+) comp19510_c0_seq1:47-808(+)
MSSVGSGYDLSATTYSPDGRVFQVDYAVKAVEVSGTVLGARCKDGVVLAAEKLVFSKLYVKGSNRRILTADKHIGLGLAGLYPDARNIAQNARGECEDYRGQYGMPIPVSVLAERLGGYMQSYTVYGHLRPFGVSTVIAGYDDINGPQLYMTEPSGLTYGYHGIALGKGALPAKTELQKLNLAGMTCNELLPELIKIIYSVHDDVKDKPFELEMGWVGKDVSGGRFERVPEKLQADAEEKAKREIAEQDMEED